MFSFDETVTVSRLQELAWACFDKKRGSDEPPYGALKELLLTGDDEFVHRTFRLPRELAGNDVTYATPCLFVRERDLADGYLSTAAQLILAHPKHPEHICAVPLALWRGDNAVELLGDRSQE